MSVDGGTSWTLWPDFPRVPVRSIVTHPRERDLVIGTHGRGAWILDDVRPLEALASDATVTDETLHLFPIPPAVQYVEGQVNGPRFTGHGMFLGENRTYGALLSYWVGGGPDADGEAVDTTAWISVLQGDSVIRTFRGSAKAGLNRTAWDLTMDGFRSPREAGTKPPEVLPSGPGVLPGTYTVRVAVAGDTATGTVRVDADPRVSVTAADRRANLEAVLHAGQRQEVAAEAVTRLREAKRSIDQAKEALAARDDDATRALVAAGDSLKEELTGVEELFTGEQELQGFADAPNAVLGRIGGVLYALTSSADAPTPEARRLQEQADQLLESALARYNTVVGEDLPAYRRRLDAAEVQVFAQPGTLTTEWKGPSGPPPEAPPLP